MSTRQAAEQRRCFEQGICFRCRAPRDGKQWLCSPCREKESAAAMVRYNKRKAEGRCPLCKRKLRSDRFVCCGPCRAKMQARQAKRRMDRSV